MENRNSDWQLPMRERSDSTDAQFNVLTVKPEDLKGIVRFGRNGKSSQSSDSHAFREHFLNYAEKSVFTPMVYLVENGKKLFSNTIGLEYIYQLLRKVGPGKWKYNFSLYTLSMRMEPRPYIERTLGFGNEIPTFGVGEIGYSGGGFSLPFALWNYIWRNVGKLAGLIVSTPILIFTVPYSLMRATFDYTKERYQKYSAAQQSTADVVRNLEAEAEEEEMSDSSYHKVSKVIGVSAVAKPGISQEEKQPPIYTKSLYNSGEKCRDDESDDNGSEFEVTL